MSEERSLKEVLDDFNEASYNQSEQLTRDKTEALTKEIVRLGLQKFKFALKNLIHLSPFISDELNREVLFKKHNYVWKGIFIGSVLKLDKIKKFVKKILTDQLSLNEDCTLEEFHKRPSNTYQLNFTTLDLSKGCIHFLNFNTAPNMPVWAAILASMSLPFFMSPFKVKPEWL